MKQIVTPEQLEGIKPLLEEALNTLIAHWDACNAVERILGDVELETEHLSGFTLDWNSGDTLTDEQAQSILEELKEY